MGRDLIYAEGFYDSYYALQALELLKHGIVIQGAELTITNDPDVVVQAKEFSRRDSVNPLVV